ncbi:MAG: energy transducer TonB [candidate division KSB1 bacterium]|nr:energy transducer TonB [candidate division KSB1 bacterium]MDQ7063683.1 energy transducer TonB [candidate division KSB1 bacterium]
MMRYPGLCLALVAMLALTLADASGAQSLPEGTTQKAREKLIRRAKPEFYLWSLPNQIAVIRQELRRWHELRDDPTASADGQRALEKLIQMLLSMESGFAEFYEAYREEDLELQPILEFFDESVRNRLQWFANFVAGPEWQRLHSSIDSLTLDRVILHGRFSALSEFRWALSDVLIELQKLAEKVPGPFQRKFSDRWRRADIPAVPVGGYVALQKRLRGVEALLPRGFDELVVVSALIDENGRVLRAQVTRPSGIAIADHAVANLVQRLDWQPARRKGKPFKTETRIPIRLWRKW